MKQLFPALAVLALCSFLGCDYYLSDVPITRKPVSEVKEELLGDWIIIDDDDSIIYPGIVVHMIESDPEEYLIIVKYMEDKGRTIDDGIVYKAFHSNVGDQHFLSVQNVLDNELDNKYIFWRLEEVGKDSVVARYITDSLNIQFDKSKKLKSFIKKNKAVLENEYLSDAIPFYRWQALKWNFVNPGANTEDIVAFWVLDDRITKDSFQNMTKVALDQMKKRKCDLSLVPEYFNDSYLSPISIWSWFKSVPYYGVLLYENGSMIKVKISETGSSLHDLTNDIYYRNEATSIWEKILDN